MHFVGVLIASALVGPWNLLLISFNILQSQLEVTKMMYAIFQILIFVCPCSSCRFLCHVIFGFFENFLISPFQDVTVFTLNTFFFSLPSTIIFSFVALDVFQNSHRLDGNLHLWFDWILFLWSGEVNLVDINVVTIQAKYKTRCPQIEKGTWIMDKTCHHYSLEGHIPFKKGGSLIHLAQTLILRKILLSCHPFSLSMVH